MNRIETKYFSYCKKCRILWSVKQNHDQPTFTMNSTNLLKSAAATAVLAAVFYGLANINTDLTKVGIVIGYVATAAILGLAAFDGARRTS